MVYSSTTKITMIKRFHSNLYYAADLDKTGKFYDDLGFEVQKEGGALRIKIGDFTLAFMDQEMAIIQKGAHAQPRGIGVFTYVEVEDVDQYFQTIKEKGACWGNVIC